MSSELTYLKLEIWLSEDMNEQKSKDELDRCLGKSVAELIDELD